MGTFPRQDDTGYLTEPKRQIAEVIAVSNIVFTLHDLRRTFATVDEGLDIRGYTLKRLLNHTIHGDVATRFNALFDRSIASLPWCCNQTCGYPSRSHWNRGFVHKNNRRFGPS